MLSFCRPDVDSFQPLRIASEIYQVPSVAVPSRVLTVSKSRPLEGVRIAVKDIFNFKGLRNSLCNRAYYEVASPSLSTAPCIQSLIDAGAQVLGLTKLSSLIGREEPTEAVDYQAPFNCRGDGYQSPAGSSSGSAVAVATYDWIDFAIGSDTTGSGRRPALVNGCFQFRPSHDSISLEGMVPTFLDFDTPCVFGRDIQRFETFIRAWYGPPETDGPIGRSRPTSVIYPLEYFPTENKEQMRCIDSFVSDLESFLGIKASRISIAERWEHTKPEDANGQSVQEYLRDAIVQTFYHEFYNSTEGFRAQYQQKHHKSPYINSFTRWRWNLGKNVTRDQHKESMHRLHVYKIWFLTEIMNHENKDSLILLPISNVEPNYRDTPPKAPAIQEGFESLFLTPILGAPDIVVPIGQVPYESKVSGRTEYLPVCVDLVGAPGMDTALIRTAQGCLESAGRETCVRTGETMFDVAP